MNKILCSLIIITVPLAVTAQQVSLQTAMETAIQFRQSSDGANLAPSRNGQSVTLSYTAQTGNNNDFYVFNYPGNEGFVIVSADTRTISPILAYSTQGSFNAQNIPDNAAFMLSSYQQQIESLRQNHTGMPSNLTSPNTHDVVVEPLIKTTWNQVAPYNAMCPIDPQYGKQCPAGCGSTVLAQIMNYWKWPEKGHGMHHNPHDTTLYVNFDQSVYDWDNTLVKYNNNSDSIQLKNIQKIMYDCGIATNMLYRYGGSSTDVISIRNALISYFDYKTTCNLIYYDNLLDQENPDSVWISTIKKELTEGRPVPYIGIDNNTYEGHGFICDGYDDQNYFHMNFGWGGYLDGYYLIPTVTLRDESISYNSQLTIITGVEPDPNEEYNDGQILFTPLGNYHRVILDAIIIPYDNPQSLVIPETVKVNGSSYLVSIINSYAFRYYYSITDIQFPTGLYQLGPASFAQCMNLTSVEIPSSIAYINPAVFYGCNNLRNITVNERNNYYYSPAGSNAIMEISSKRLVQGCNYTTLPSDVKIIGENSFYAFDKILSVNLPLSVTEIEDDAYGECSNLTEVYLNANIKAIGYRAFEGCTSLTDVYCYAAEPPQIHSSTFPKSVTIHVTSEAAPKYGANKTWSYFTIVDDLTDLVEQPVMTDDANNNEQHYYDIMGRQTDYLYQFRIIQGKKYYY